MQVLQDLFYVLLHVLFYLRSLLYSGDGQRGGRQTPRRDGALARSTPRGGQGQSPGLGVCSTDCSSFVIPEQIIHTNTSVLTNQELADGGSPTDRRNQL